MENNFKDKFLVFFYVFCIGILVLAGVYFFKDNNKEEETFIENVSKITYEKRKYTCEAGETLKIKTTASDGFDYINFYSSNIENANVYESNESCDNCKYIIVDCIKAGKVNIGSKYNNKIGELVSLSISAGFNNGNTGSSNTGSSNAGSSNTGSGNTGSSNTGSSNTGSGNTSSGNTSSGNTSSGNTSSGNTSSGSNKKSIEKVIFDQSSYSCVTGKKIYATITATSTKDKNVTINSYSISDTSIATVSENKDKKSDCKNCKYIIIDCKKSGKTNITAKSSTNASSSVNINVSKIDVGKINYDKTTYSCKEGNTIEAIITISPTDNNSIKSYTSSNEKIATITKNTNANLNCKGCESVTIKCLKEGKVTLGATSELGATNTVELTVKKEDIGTISFEKKEYKCVSGGSTIVEGNVILSAVNSSYPIVSSYKSSNENVAKVEKKGDKSFKITCINNGTITISATTSLGAVGETKVSVIDAYQGTIKYEKTEYTCLKGETINTKIVADGLMSTGEESKVKTFTSSNKKYASIEATDTKEVTKNIKISCNAVGTSTLKATSTTGVTTATNTTVKVVSSIGNIKFDKDSYTCTEGNTKTTIKVTASGESSSGVKASLSTIASSDEKIATTKILSTNNGVSEVEITCIKNGSVTLKAVSTLKATATSKLTVSKNVGQISFSSSELTCMKGETLTTTLTTSGSLNGTNNYISNVKNSSTSIVGVTTPSGDNQTNKTITIECKANGSATLTGVSTLGSTSKLTVNVKSSIGTISYAETKYSCEVGKSFETKITATGTTSAGKKAEVNSFNSSDTSIATISEVSSGSGYKNVKVSCLKAGSVTLSAKSTLGASASSPTLTVSSNKGSISFKDNSFECLKGEEFTTIVTASGTKDSSINEPSSISSSSSAVTSSLTSNSTCTNGSCKTVNITCKSVGSSTLTVKSTYGSTSTATVKVSSSIGSIKFDNTTYTCEEGNYFYAVLTPSGKTAAGKIAEVNLESLKSSNDTYVKIEKDTTQKVCDNCVSIKISCLKKYDSVTLSAKSTLYASTPTTKVKVTQNKGDISFASTSYSCNVGDIFTTSIKATVNSNLNTLTSNVDTVTSANTAIATIDKTGKIECKKAGKTTFTAKSTLGATKTVEIYVN